MKAKPMCCLGSTSTTDAYQWARRRSCHVSCVSGPLHVVDVEAAETAVRQVLPQAIPNPLLASCGDVEMWN